MISYEQQICDAIEVMTEQALLDAEFNCTIQATIIECTNADTCEYKVSYQNSKFLAYAINTNVTYVAGTQVFILIPNNDMTKPKMILTSVRNQGIIKGSSGSGTIVNTEDAIARQKISNLQSTINTQQTTIGNLQKTVLAQNQTIANMQEQIDNLLEVVYRLGAHFTKE